MSKLEAKDYVSQAAECGQRAARAQWHRDASMVSFQREAANRVIRMFKGSERDELERAYSDAYRAEWSQYDLGVRS